MTIRLWPKEFEKKEHITKLEKELLRYADSHFADGHIAVGIDPLGISTDKYKMGLYLSPKKGLITFTIYPTQFEGKASEIYQNYVQIQENKIYKRLLDSKILISRNGTHKTLKFPYKHLLIFQSQDEIQLDKKLFEKIDGYVSASNFTPINKKSEDSSDIFSNIRCEYDPSFKEISEHESRAIFERLAPEYTVVLHEEENVDIKENKDIEITNQSLDITGEEVEYKTFFLDDYQVSLVNDMGSGHRVILANPGAGKSVLLLSKAFKYASTYKKSKVLLTCYNNNLAELYNFKRGCADYGSNNNLFIMTFHKLVRKLYEEGWHRKCSTIPTNEEINNCLYWIKEGCIPKSFHFDAIFIDEVQIFDPLYLELCYNLLNKNNNNHIFLMAGDLNQTVRTQSRRGDAPWKKINGVNLDFSGRVRYIEKNYRNSILIGNYLNSMLGYMNQKMDEHHMINIKEFEYNSFDVCDSQSIALNVKTGINRKEIQSEIVNSIKDITSKYDIRYSDIAILFPYRERYAVNYPLLYWIQKAFDLEDIPYSLIISSKNGRYEKTRYSETSGVVLSTIDSSLGLDFKAVILAGLYPYNYIINGSSKKEIKNWDDVDDLTDEEKEEFQIQIRKVYTAASRARDILYVLSDLSEGSPMEDIIKNRSNI